MSNGAKISAIGLYKWDNTIFDLMRLPSGLDRNTVSNNIMLDTSEFEVIYPNPVLFKSYVGLWSEKRLASWQRIYDVLLQEYDPLENYRRNESRSLEQHKQSNGVITNDLTDATTATSNKREESSGNTHSAGSSSGTEHGTIDADGGHNTTIENQVAAFNASSYSPRDKSIEDNEYEDNQTTNTTTSANNRTSTDTAGLVLNTDSLNNTLRKTGTIDNAETNSATDTENTLAYGNIGVTTSQQMLEQEIDVAKHNIIEIIIADFKKEFCVCIY